MGYTKKSDNVSIIRGCGSDQLADDDYVYFIDAGNAGNISGVIYEWRSTPYELVKSGTAELQPGSGLDLDEPSGVLDDLSWDGVELAPLAEITGLARIANINLEPEALPGLMYGDEPLAEAGDSTSGNAYAVLTSEGYYAKLRIFRDAAENKVKAEWYTYGFSQDAVVRGFGYRDPRDLVLAEEQDITVAYISCRHRPAVGMTERGVVAKVPMRKGSRDFELFNFSAHQVATFQTPRNDPQQLALHGGFVYVVNGDALLKIDPVAKTHTVVLEGLISPKGLLLNADATRAYVTDSAEGGRLVSIDIPASGPAQLNPALQRGLGAVGFLDWADNDRSSLYLSKPGGGEVRRVNSLEGLSIQSDRVLTSEDADGDGQPDGPARPQGMLAVSDRSLFVLGETEFGTLDIELPVQPGEVLLGIGLIPFTYINQDTESGNTRLGRADTSGTGYFFRVDNVPLGGTLNLMLNHEAARNVGARYYRARFVQENTPVEVADRITDFVWDANTARWVPEANATRLLPNIGTVFEVRAAGRLWYNPYLSVALKSRLVRNGLTKLEVDFYDENGRSIAGMHFERWLLIDNNASSVSLRLPIIGGVQRPLTCGALQYGAKTDEFRLDYTVYHPTGSASYDLNFYGGGRWLPPPVSTSGTASSTQTLPPKVLTVGEVIGNCNIANVYISLGSTVRVTNGYGWIGSASTGLSFTLVPDTIPLES